MANPSRTRPWVVQMQADGEWYDVEAHRDQETAEAMAKIARGRATDTDWRVAKATGYLSRRRIEAPRAGRG